jgi:hypothetical protein
VSGATAKERLNAGGAAVRAKPAPGRRCSIGSLNRGRCRFANFAKAPANCDAPPVRARKSEIVAAKNRSERAIRLKSAIIRILNLKSEF